MNSRTGLADGEGDGDIRVPGEMFRLMNETLPGTRSLTLADNDGRETEASGETADVHLFYAPDRLVTFIASTSDESSEQVVDFLHILRDMGDVSITRLGVADGDNPSLSTAEPVVTEENPDDLIEDGILVADLAPYEILVIEMFNPTFSAEVATLSQSATEIPDLIDPELPDNVLNFSDFVHSDASAPDAGENLIETLSTTEEPREDPQDAALPAEADEGGGGDFGFGALALAFLPILLLAA